MLWHNDIVLCIILVVVAHVYGSEPDLVHVQTFHGNVGAENFTYYKLTLEGHVMIKLHSYEGDADLYLSTESLKPTWDDYTMKSDTCSDDIVVVRRYQKRPIGIGVYGYTQYPISRFRLSVFIDSSKDNYYPESDATKTTDNGFSNTKPRNPYPSNPYVEEEEESLLWNLFVGFLRVLLDVLI